MQSTRVLFGVAGLVALVMAIPSTHGAGDAPLELVASIEMPAVKGRIDHLAMDLQRRRLFVAALGNDTVEVLDIARNRHERSLTGFGEPQGVLYLPQTNRLYVTNGSASRVDVLDAASFATVSSIPRLDDADNVRHDAAGNRVVVGYGSGALHVMDASSGEEQADIRLAAHPESFQLERNGNRIFVNLPNARQIAVVDRARREVSATWEVPARSNFPMALDEMGGRLFVGARSPAVMLVYDTASGKVVAKVPIGRDTDDVFFDAGRKRVYVICGEGRVDVFRQDDPDHYSQIGTIKTALRARTGLFVPEESSLYVAAPAVGGTTARILVYRVP